MKSNRTIFIGLFMAMLCTTAALAAPLGNGFTYQGRLVVNGVAATGTTTSSSNSSTRTQGRERWPGLQP